MAFYDDIKQEIISTLMGKPVGTEIRPEKQQEYELNMLDYIRSLELISASSFMGIAESNTAPIQPNNSRVCYIGGVSKDETIVFSNFIDQNGQPISITTGNDGAFVVFIWNTQYWTSQTFLTDIITQIEQNSYSYNIKKTYDSFASMENDTVYPIGTDGNLINIGDIVTIVNPNNPSENAIYSRIQGGWQSQSGIFGELKQELGNDPNSTISQKIITVLFDQGYLYCGIATPSSSPIANLSKIFYLAKSAGTYTNFDNLNIYNDSLAVFAIDSGVWNKYQITPEYSNILIDAFIDGWVGSDKKLFINYISRNDPTNGSNISIFVSDRDGNNAKQAVYYSSLPGVKSGIEQLSPMPIVDNLGTITLTINWDAVPDFFNASIDPVNISKKYFQKGILIQGFENESINSMTVYNLQYYFPLIGSVDPITNQVTIHYLSSIQNRLNVLPIARKAGLIITYQISDKNWIKEQYLISLVDDANWQLDSNWIQLETVIDAQNKADNAEANAINTASGDATNKAAAAIAAAATDATNKASAAEANAISAANIAHLSTLNALAVYNCNSGDGTDPFTLPDESSGVFFNLNSARDSVPTSLRKLGLIIVFKIAITTWKAYQYNYSDLTGWDIDANWAEFGGKEFTGSVNAQGHLILTFSDNSTVDCGLVVGPQGIPGISAPLTLSISKQGSAGIISPSFFKWINNLKVQTVELMSNCNGASFTIAGVNYDQNTLIGITLPSGTELGINNITINTGYTTGNLLIIFTQI